MRMCESCEVDIDTYNHSLKYKTNLLNAERHPSMMRSSDGSAAVKKGEGSQNAPRNNNNDKYDSPESEEDEGT